MSIDLLFTKSGSYREIYRYIGRKRSQSSIDKQMQTRKDRNIYEFTVLSPQSIEKMKCTKNKEQRRWYNNGKISKSFTVKIPPPDDSWVLGRLPWLKVNN